MEARALNSFTAAAVSHNSRPCTKCGGPIGFRKSVYGNWQVCELDGSDHWDICNTRQIQQGRKPPRADKPGKITQPSADITHLWSRSDLPPWDESLGCCFRNFTAEEMAEGAVCVPRQQAPSTSVATTS